eukprot:TRINITY_DN1927_c0_g1_i1.p1 TRINITY_DN1927_c0_g1~~TRINITY_DN1927_c0_g1_i1.p1  ORF type:complete len:484 (+),score=102.35 TRINITY_DN1927_c0_g1_i1:24-1475(+)
MKKSQGDLTEEDIDKLSTPSKSNPFKSLYNKLGGKIGGERVYSKVKPSSSFSIDDDDDDAPAIPLDGNSVSVGESEDSDRDVVIGGMKDDNLKEEESMIVKEDNVALSAEKVGFFQKHTGKISFMCCVFGLLCTAWIGPCFKLLGREGVGALRRASWRSQALSILLFIPFIIEYRTLTRAQKQLLISRSVVFQLILCGVFWLFDLALWSNSLEYTTIPRASVFANSYSLMLIVYYKILKVPLSALEIIGATIGFLGIVTSVVCTRLFGDAGQIDESSTAKNPLLGDLLALLAAGAIGAYVVVANKARASVTVFVYTFTNTLFLAVFLSIGSFILEGTKIDSSVNGIFGWVNPDFALTIIGLAVVAGLIGFNLNNFGLKYVPPLIYSLINLCDPVLSGTYGWLIKVDGVPGVFTFVGGGITLSGIVILSIGQDRRKKREIQARAEEETGIEFVIMGEDGSEEDVMIGAVDDDEHNTSSHKGEGK